MQDLSTKITFSAPESFQLVMTGVKYLRAYERTSEWDSLNRATEALATGMRKFPDDIAPRFYLGVAKAVSGAKNSLEAVDLLEDLLKRVDRQHMKELCLVVKYNLASAHAGTYEENGFTRARGLLEQVLKETREGTLSDIALRRQAEILLIWLDIRAVRKQKLAIQEKRKQKVLLAEDEMAEFTKKVNEIQHSLKEFKKKFDREDVPDHERNEVMADYWNNVGIVEWYLAEVVESEDERKRDAQQAITSFRKSVQCKLNWPPPRSNMAAVYSDILHDSEKAKEIWLSILDTEPTHDYAMLNLGYLAEEDAEKAEKQNDPDKARDSWDEAVKWFRKADSRGATLRLARVLVKNLNKPDEAKTTLDALLENLDVANSDDSKYRSEAYEIMGIVEERLGNRPQAIAAYEKSDRADARDALRRLVGGNSGSNRP